MKRFFAFILTMILIIGTAIPVEAGTRSNREAQAAGNYMAEIMDLIMTRYMGDPVTIEALFEGALRGMTDILDQYSIYLSAAELAQFTEALTGRLVGIGVSIATLADGRTEIVRVLPDTPAQEAGILPGDIIISVDGINVSGMSRDAIVALITNPDTERVLISIERGGYPITFDILKAVIQSPTVITERLELISEAYGLAGDLHYFRYMQINSVGLATGNDVRRAIERMQSEDVQGIILDLRGNTGGYLDVTVDIANQLVPQGVILQTVNRAGRRRTYSSVLPEPPFNNIVVLVNRFTASAAEVIASALQDSGAAIIVGEPTFGKGLVQSVYTLQTGGALKLTTEEYFRRNGGTINDIGVIPCIHVERRINLDEQDHTLRRGLELLLQGGGVR